MDFKDWLEQHGCMVEIAQEDDGSGYVVLEVSIPAYKAEVGSSAYGEPITVSVNT